MQFIPRKVHGYLDYIVGIVLIIAPWLLGFSDKGGAAVAMPIIVGAVIIVSSLMTNYELSVVKVIPFAMHLMLDVILGVVLAASPWVLGYSDDIWWPHLVVGILLIGAGLCTRHDNRVPAAVNPNA